MIVERNNMVEKAGKVGKVIAASEGGVVVRWADGVTLEKASDLTLAAAPVRVGIAPELRAELDSWQVPE